jgi:potassium-transporting ATPase KdpC subunit
VQGPVIDEELKSESPSQAAALVDFLREFRQQIRPALVGIAVLTLLAGILFPLVLAGLGRLLFPHQAAGSLIAREGVTVGSEWIGQDFSGPGYFHSRPSAAGDGYDATASGGTNLGPANPKLRDGQKRTLESNDKAFAGVRQLADAYRRTNGLAPDVAIPIDAVTRSGSGLDPHISPADAALQVPRVVRERHLSEETVRRLVDEYIEGRQLGFLGQPRVNVLSLNLVLDRIAKQSPEQSP